MRKKLFSNDLPEPLLSLALFLFRCAIALMMLIGHGWGKCEDFDKLKTVFPVPDFPLLGWMNHTSALVMTIFAEVVCCAFIVFGFATRISAGIVAFTMAMGAFVIHEKDPTFFSPGAQGGFKELALMYLIGFLMIALTGAGKWSIDAKLSQVKRRMFS